MTRWPSSHRAANQAEERPLALRQACMHACLHAFLHACMHEFLHACNQEFMQFQQSCLATVFWLVGPQYPSRPLRENLSKKQAGKTVAPLNFPCIHASMHERKIAFMHGSFLTELHDPGFHFNGA